MDRRPKVQAQEAAKKAEQRQAAKDRRESRNRQARQSRERGSRPKGRTQAAPRSCDRDRGAAGKDATGRPKEGGAGDLWQATELQGSFCLAGGSGSKKGPGKACSARCRSKGTARGRTAPQTKTTAGRLWQDPEHKDHAKYLASKQKASSEEKETAPRRPLGAQPVEARMGEGNGNGKAPVLGCGMSVFNLLVYNRTFHHLFF